MPSNYPALGIHRAVHSRKRQKMRFLCSLAVLLALCAPASAQSAPADPQQLLQTAFQRSDLFHAAASPFVYAADFTAQFKVPTPGTIVVHWASSTRWRVEIKVGAFAMIKTRNGEQTLTLRNVAFTPVRVQDLLLLLRLDSTEPNLSALNLKKRRQNGRPLDCIQYEQINSLHACVDPSTGDLVSQESQWIEGKRQAEFSAFADFDGLRIPHHMSLQTNTGNLVSVDVTRLADDPFDDKLLELPKEAIARRECVGEKPPTSIKMSQIDWPPGTRVADVMTTITVLQDGSVADVEVLGGSSKQLNEAVANALMKWKFKPAMCGSDPVNSEIQMAVQSRSY